MIEVCRSCSRGSFYWLANADADGIYVSGLRTRLVGRFKLYVVGYRNSCAERQSLLYVLIFQESESATEHDCVWIWVHHFCQYA